MRRRRSRRGRKADDCGVCNVCPKKRLSVSLRNVLTFSVVQLLERDPQKTSEYVKQDFIFDE